MPGRGHERLVEGFDRAAHPDVLAEFDPLDSDPIKCDTGYRLVAADGGIFNFGDAAFHGSAGNIRLNRPIVGMLETASGNGYWFVAADGGIFNYGDAQFCGSTGRLRLNSPIIGMT